MSLAVVDTVARAVVSGGDADVIPRAAAAWNAWSNCCMAWAVQLDSGRPN